MNMCRVCSVDLPEPARGRKPKYCGSRCRVSAHRELKRSAAFLGRIGPPAQAVRLSLKVPDELRRLDRWIRHSEKRPMAIGGWWCSVTDPSHWGPFTDAVTSTYGDGVGFVLNGDGIVCLDLDDCVVDGVLSQAARRFVDELPNTYIEFSPSNRGLHVWGYGFMDRGRRFTVDGLKVEAYPDGRYLTMTGNALTDYPLAVLDLQRVVG
jgi:primase-polymerase (primpol)-like protein